MRRYTRTLEIEYDERYEEPIEPDDVPLARIIAALKQALIRLEWANTQHGDNATVADIGVETLRHWGTTVGGREELTCV